MSSAITTLGAAALSLHRDFAENGITKLEEIYEALPDEAEVTIDIILSADFDSGGKVYQCATALLAKEGDDLGVNASIGSYIAGEYQTPCLALEGVGVPPATSTASDSTEIQLMRYPLIANTQAIPEDADPLLLRIAGHVNAIFKDGIILPADQRFHYCSLVVMVKTPTIPRALFLAMHRGARGTGEKRGVDNPWSTWCYGFEYDGQFEASKAAALGRARPQFLALEAERVDVRTFGGVISDVGRAALTGSAAARSLEGAPADKK